jgi:hypothetical protein
VRAYLAMMQARRALSFGHPGHTTRRGTGRPGWVLRHRAPRRSPRYHLVWLGFGEDNEIQKLAWSSHQTCPPGRGILRIIPAWLALFPGGTEGMRGTQEGRGGIRCGHDRRRRQLLAGRARREVIGDEH